MVNLLNSELGEGDNAPMPPGTMVSHKVFGQGTIVSFNPSAQSYRVKFADSERDLVARVLTKL